MQQSGRRRQATIDASGGGLRFDGAGSKHRGVAAVVDFRLRAERLTKSAVFVRAAAATVMFARSVGQTQLNKAAHTRRSNRDAAFSRLLQTRSLMVLPLTAASCMS